MTKRIINFALLMLMVVLSAASLQDERTKYFPRITEYVDTMPPADHLWLFVLAGQSNMAGRGLVEPCDTFPDPRILSVTPDMRWIIAKEPLHLYQPALTGLDPGLAFARTLLENVDDDIYIGLIPCAVGGSSTEEWLDDLPVHDIRLKSNITEKIQWAKKYGTIKGIIWHQGESDAMEGKIAGYRENTTEILNYLRSVAGNDKLPVVIGELGIFPGVEKNRLEYMRINDILASVAAEDSNIAIAHSSGTSAGSDNVHFDSPSQRIMGKRYAEAWLSLVHNEKNK